MNTYNFYDVYDVYDVYIYMLCTFSGIVQFWEFDACYFKNNYTLYTQSSNDTVHETETPQFR